MFADAIQVELGLHLREKEGIEKAAEAFAKSLVDFYDHYVCKEVDAS